jgi:hypothetical protein
VASILVSIEKGVEVAAEDLLSWVGKANTATSNNGPGALAALGVLAAAIDKALTDVAAGAATPATLPLAIPGDISDVKAVWPDIKAFLVTLGIKV